MLEDHKHEHATHNFDGIIENRVNSPPVYFTVLFYGLIIWGIIFIAYYLLSGWSSQAEFQEKMAAHTGAPTQTEQATQGTTTPAATDGKSLYTAHCAGCHGDDATGGFGSDLTATTYKYGKSSETVKESILNGRGSSMPAFSGQLSGPEIEALTEYLLQL
ncbi:MAG TPA: c-type cytochrome [Geopsychrobacteraceae bacterium]|nr:c-type cytochrome [Geopsychrobacteraceae bacterium]